MGFAAVELVKPTSCTNTGLSALFGAGKLRAWWLFYADVVGASDLVKRPATELFCRLLCWFFSGATAVERVLYLVIICRHAIGTSKAICRGWRGA